MLPGLSLESIRNDDENRKNKTGETENETEADDNKDVRNMKKAVFGVLGSSILHHNDRNSG